MSLHVRSVTRSYGARTVLKDAGIDVPAGTMAVLRGPNGAGKSTLLRIIATHVRPEQGSVQVAGIDALRRPDRARRAIGYVPDRPPLYPDLSPLEHLRFWGRLHRLGADAAARAHDAARDAGLGNSMHRPAGQLSRGQRQRLAIAIALLAEPAAILLDEPTTGLDGDGAQWLSQRLAQACRNGACVLAAAHGDDLAGDHVDEWQIADGAVVRA